MSGLFDTVQEIIVKFTSLKSLDVDKNRESSERQVNFEKTGELRPI